MKNRPSDGTEPEPIDNGGYFDMTSHDSAHTFRRDAVTTLEALGISVEFSHHEVAPGQQEIDLRYADALSMADNIMTFRHVIKEVAIAHGAHATFMPKPFRHRPGSGMHTHLSLFEGDRNAFHDPTDELNLSKTARAFIAGLLRHAREITAVTNQWVNSYKRLFGYAARGRTGRGADLRLLGPRQPVGARAGAHVQAGQGQLDAGRDALARLGLQPVPGLRGPARGRHEGRRGGLRAAARSRGRRVVAVGHRATRARATTSCRTTSPTRCAPWRTRELVAETLGEHVFDFFLRNKRSEWNDYRAEVTPFELRRYLPLL